MNPVRHESPGAVPAGLRAWRWLVHVETSDPLRRRLNQGLAACIVVVAVAAALGIPLTALQGKSTLTVIAAASLPIYGLTWFLNRRGTVYGAWLLVATLLLATTATLVTFGKSVMGMPIPAGLIAAVVVAALFVRPRAALQVFLLELIALVVVAASLGAVWSETLYWLMRVALVEGMVVALVMMGATLLWRALHDATAANTRLEREIHEHRRADVALRQSEERYRKVVENFPGGSVTICNRESRILFSGGSMLARAGKKMAEVIGRRVAEFVPEDQHVLLEGYFRRAFAGETITYETSTRGGTAYFSTVSPLHAANGAIEEILIVAVDITERKQAEQKLRAARDRLQEAQKLGRIGNWEFDLATRDSIWSDEIFVLYERDPALGAVTEDKAMALYYAPEESARIAQFVAAAVATGERQDFEVRPTLSSGRKPYYHVIVTVEKDRAGKPVKLLGTMQDVTGRKGFEDALRESEQLFRQLAENIDGIFWLSDLTVTKFFYVSPAYERLWSASRESLRADARAWLAVVHPEDRARIWTQHASQQATHAHDYTYRILRTDGVTRWMHDRAFPVKDAAGTVVRLAGIIEDITEKKRLEAQFLRAQRLESIGTLTGGIAHDLNNILSPITLSAPMLRLDLPAAEKDKMVRAIETSARRAAELIKQLLTFGRGLESGQTIVAPQLLLNDIVPIIRETFPRDIAIKVEVADDAWPTRGDPTQLQQVLLNLCVNARDAMPDGGTLTIGANNTFVDEQAARSHPEAKPGSYLVLRVQDTGTGIAPEITDKIFDPFFTTKAFGKGTGLGLSIVHGITKSHGGFVSMQSRPRQGTTFLVHLPALPGATASAGSGEGTTPPMGGGEDRLILVVDDEEGIRFTVSEALRRYGYRVLTAIHGADALERYGASAGEIQVVLTDLEMPVMDGVALIVAMKKLNPAVKIVVASGVASFRGIERRQAELSALGVTEILRKPYSVGRVLNTLHRLFASEASSHQP